MSLRFILPIGGNRITATKLDLTKEYKTYYTAKTSPEVVEFGESQTVNIGKRIKL